MQRRKTSRARHTLRVLFVLAIIVVCPLAAHAEAPTPETPAADALDGADARVPSAQDPSALTPPRLLDGVSPVLPELPVGSEPVSVVIELTVDREGLASDAVVLASGGREPDRAALAAVSALRFSPALRGAEPIVARIPFRFEFHAAAPPPPPPAPTPTTAPVTEPAGEGTSEEITLDVQGQRPPRETTVHAIEIVESRKIPGTNGDPLRAIESMPGVARPSAADAQLIVRGSSPNDTAVFIDGIRIPVGYHLGGFSSVVQNDALEKLEFRPGNFGAEYGRAMGGTVELGLRAPRRDRLAGVAQIDSIDGRLLLEGPLGKRTRFMLAARRSWLDTWVGSLDENIKAAPVYYDGQAVLEHDLTSRTTARLFFVGSDDRMKLLFSAPSASDPSEGGKLNIGYAFTRLALRIDSRLTDDTTLRHVLSWGTDHINIVEGAGFQDISAHTLDWRSELRTRFNSYLSGAVGVDANFWKYRVRLRVPPYEATDEVDNPTFSRPFRSLGADVWLVRPAVYAMLEITPLPGVRIVPSVRADYAQDTQQVTIDPRLSMRADVHPGFPRTTLKGGVGLYAQPPQGVESVKPFGSSGVQSNRSLHTSVGVEQELARGLELSLEGYYKKLYDLVVARTSENDTNVGASFANTGSGRVYGGETLLRYRAPNGRYFGWVAYTLSRSERRNTKGEDYHLFQFDQTHILTALGNAQLGRRGWSLGFRFRYVTGSPYTPYVGGVVDLDAGAYTPIAGAPYGARLPAYQQLDLRLDKTWTIGRAKLIAYGELRNTYNHKNPEGLGYKYDYSRSEIQSGIPILPVIGLRGEL